MKNFHQFFLANDVSIRANLLIWKLSWVSSFASYTGTNKSNKFQILDICFRDHKLLYIQANELVTLAINFAILQFWHLELEIRQVPRGWAIAELARWRKLVVYITFFKTFFQTLQGSNNSSQLIVIHSYNDLGYSTLRQEAW